MDVSHYKEEQQIDETGTWLSISDLMAGLLMVFALLLIVTLAQLFEFQEQSKSNRIIIIEEIQKGLEEVGIESQIDSKGTLSLVEGLQFDANSAHIDEKGQDFLSKLIPIYSRVIFQERNNIDKDTSDISEEVNYLVIEGHADLLEGKNNGMSLSLRRAEAVTNWLETSIFPYKGDLLNKVLPAGRGSLEANPNLPANDNRKVIFRFEFKSHDITELMKKGSNVNDL
ncbi:MULTISPECIES: chemotaxis protein MotB [unclassified Shewanella]|uniref:chemotaxis protein MotB n=1 Tax=unclassified Shewanella TaxID=196818 RepID=UPI00354E79D8